MAIRLQAGGRPAQHSRVTAAFLFIASLTTIELLYSHLIFGSEVRRFKRAPPDEGDGMANDVAERRAGRVRGGPFAKGQSGNPGGRRRGSRNKATLAAQMLLADEAEALTRKAVKLALDGDPTALRLCVERILPHDRRPQLLETSQAAYPPGIQPGHHHSAKWCDLAADSLQVQQTCNFRLSL